MSTSSVSSTRLRDLSRTKLLMPVNSWKDEIKKSQLRIKELEIAIEVFRELDRAGEPWPVAQSENHDQGEQHSV